jgi:hypothetical protein
MALSILADKDIIPDENQLKTVLGDSILIWKSIVEFANQNIPAVEEQWNYSGKNYGWGFRLRNTKRVIIYLIPCSNFFKIGMVFGEKATNEALNSSISDELKSIIKDAPVYAEGRGFRFDVKAKDQLIDIKNLIKIKVSG